jgi:hypothetical protein
MVDGRIEITAELLGKKTIRIDENGKPRRDKRATLGLVGLTTPSRLVNFAAAAFFFSYWVIIHYHRSSVIRISINKDTRLYDYEYHTNIIR